MGVIMAGATHHVAQSSHITVNPGASRRDLIEIFREVEPSDLLELSL
ncbi:hypothetical protein AAE026_22255 [Bradyrhizobium sp. DN5]